MARKKKEPNRADELIDELLGACSSPEDILGDSGLIKQLTQRVIERALGGELTHHLKAPSEKDNSRNVSSKKTIQSEQRDLDLSIPRDRKSSFEPILVPKHQRRISGLAMRNTLKRWTRPIKKWKAATSHFAILFPEHFPLDS